MNVELSTEQERRLALARRAFRDFRSQCFWSYRDDLIITEEDIPFVIRQLRQYGGHIGYRIVAELCQ